MKPTRPAPPVPRAVFNELRRKYKKLEMINAELQAGYISDTELREIAVELRRRMAIRKAAQSFV
jgi:hypothetical protein